MNRIPPRQKLAFNLIVAAALGIAIGAPVQAQIQQRPIDARVQNEDRIDPPARVGRLADLTGQVWLWSPDGGEWIGAQRNRPLTTGDRIATDANSRAEVNIGSTTLRLDGGSEVEVLRLDDRQISLRLHSGTAAARLRTRESADEFELVTDEGRFRATRAGRYRIDRDEEATFVTVDSGQGSFAGNRSALTVAAGQRAEFWLGGGDRLEYRMVERARDSFASWTYERDQRDDRSASARYVSPEMTGVEDLDRYGRWEQNPEYGALWIPRGVATDWAPYSTGHWAWVQPWGWTWVDDAPWGFAPFHYGRWVNVRNVWCWAPGTRVQRPVYAPALVAWVGGNALSLSISGGSRAPAVGWFPLSPREVYVPSYRHSPSYVREVNVTHITNVTVINEAINRPRDYRHDYDNRRFPHAVTVVPASIVTSRQPVGPAARQWRDSGRAVEALAPAAAVAALVAMPLAAPAQRGNADPRLIRPPVLGAPAVAAVQPVDRGERFNRGEGRGEFRGSARAEERRDGRGREFDRRAERPAPPAPVPRHFGHRC